MYSYKPITDNELRLIHLLPGKLTDPIVVDITHEAFIPESIPHYEALSYTWGSITDKNEIQVVGAYDVDGSVNTADIIFTQDSLTTALRYLRRQDDPRTLWVDAICINQGDLSERGAEVSRMGRIYERASKVVVWLGPSDSSTEATFGVLEHLGRHVDVNWKQFQWAAKTEFPQVQKQIETCFDCAYSSETKDGIEKLVNRAWFSRLWIWQEVCRSRVATITCGSYNLDWVLFSHAIVCLFQQVQLVRVRHSDKTERFDGLIPRMLHITRLVEEANEGRRDLWRLLANTQRALCHDPRDRIYAQLSMLPETMQEIIIPSYEKTVREVYIDAFLAFNQFDERKNLLGQCGERAVTSQLDIPTWVPNWSFPRKTNWFSVTSLFNACGASAREISYQGDSVLQVEGVQTCMITDTSAVIPASATYLEIIDIWRSWAPTISLAKQTPYPDRDTLFDAYCATLCCNYFVDTHPEKTLWGRISDAAALLDMLDRQEVHDSKLLTPGQHAVMLNTIHFTGGRRLLTTAEGYVGLGPAECRAGDVVGVFLGLRLPMILHPCVTGNFEIVGTCYMHGLMTKEALLGPLGSPWHAVARTTKPTLADDAGVEALFFVNHESGEETQEDPRSNPLLAPWRSYLDGNGELRFENSQTGERTWADPRLTSKELRRRGVPIRSCAIV
jgi:hypothetical protein